MKTVLAESRAKRTANRTPRTDATESVTVGSGNIFADLGLPNPELLQAKAELVRRIESVMQQRGLSDAAAAKLLKLDCGKLVDLLRGKTARFSLDRLFRFLNTLGQSVEIIVKPAAEGASVPVIEVRD